MNIVYYYPTYVEVQKIYAKFQFLSV